MANSKNILICNSIRIDLTGLQSVEVSLLRFLVLKYPNICSKAQIYEYCWGDKIVTDNSIRVAVSNIRQKLDSNGINDLIITKRNEGYSLSKKVFFSSEKSNHLKKTSLIFDKYFHTNILLTILNGLLIYFYIWIFSL